MATKQWQKKSKIKFCHNGMNLVSAVSPGRGLGYNAMPIKIPLFITFHPISIYPYISWMNQNARANKLSLKLTTPSRALNPAYRKEKVRN